MARPVEPDNLPRMILAKVFFECYRDREQKRIVMAQVLTTSKPFIDGLRLHYPVQPTSVHKQGNITRMVWAEEAAYALAQSLGEEGIKRHDYADGCG